jgi:hypothetical protein
MNSQVDLMNRAPRCRATSKRTGKPCRAPAVKGWKVCRFHGARGGGPSGSRNGNYRHGQETQSSKALKAETIALMRECRETLNKL